MFVVRGTHAFVEGYREDNPGRFAIVLVTDGYPQGCDDADDTIEAVVSEVEAARATDIATYVIGVANPPIDDAPDTVSDLHAIAEAGGTEQAFLIDTGDPGQTASAFNAAVDRIRETAITCTLDIPDPPDGRTFDKEKVAVHYRSGGGARHAARLRRRAAPARTAGTTTTPPTRRRSSCATRPATRCRPIPPPRSKSSSPANS